MLRNLKYKDVQIFGMEMSEAQIIANAMIEAAEKSGEKIAMGIKEGLCEGLNKVAEGLSGTKAELMMDLLLVEAKNNGGKIPPVGSEIWNQCKETTDNVIKEFSHEK